MSTHFRTVYELPSGRILDTRRPRSAGVLDEEEFAFCKEQGVSLSYDPVQIGWVPATAEDDISGFRRASLPVAPLATRSPGSIEFGGRYRLRPWSAADVEVFVDLLDNPRVWEFMPEDYPAPLDRDLAAFLIEISNKTDHHEVYAVEVHGEPVGQVRLAFEQAMGDGSEGEISYWLGERHWGNGIAGDLVAFYTDLCFRRRPELRSIVARVHERNAASARVLQKSGYVLEGANAASRSVNLYRRIRDGEAAGPSKLS
ncbi:GNAT family N-acetyltransferase [Roseibacterium sp. SDUM158016]|uniref:GNAT family N-acetyltransferase n=1 Tax=Roseicyclus sediminis TaxID=2980997 RepID=UPI0021CEFED6|nr:GNAT family protein [Roseibacterium sp. SDUM158016]MCU4651569.1 GNAT family N-acetyltransferase [Roseibacterium sp. SDUM158016]